MPHTLSAFDAAAKIREGRLSSVDLVKACLARIDATDGQIRAWTFVDREGALKRAGEMDALRKAGRAIGLLHGIPVGLKDIIDTKDMKTECGSPIFAGRQPKSDAAVGERLLEAGAVILGKTATTEVAFMHPCETRNPNNYEYSPGGSSSGSAAAVAAFHVPLAIGTQTNGSVIRPASFCGTYGFKPSRGMVSRRGMLQTSASLDQPGIFARTLKDVALFGDALQSYDPLDPLSPARPRPKLFEGAMQDIPVEPDIVWFDLPFADRLSPDAREAMEEVLIALKEAGVRIERMESPPAFAGVVKAHQTIHEYEINQHLGSVFTDNWDKVSDTLKPIIERARKVSKTQYEDALAMLGQASEFFDVFFNDYDVILAPAAPGEAPKFGNGTGDPIFSTIWTFSGLPCVTLPLLVGSNGMPMGVQLIGSSERDDRLMRLASWALKKLSPDAKL
jgi:Asp-tRNA(Asn)/Glu-tRNA(Gln) amidotransferase A subunit family amidase